MLYAGFDLSRKRVDVHLLDGEGETIEVGAVPPDADGLRGMTERLDRHRAPIRAAIESKNGARFGTRLGPHAEMPRRGGVMPGSDPNPNRPRSEVEPDQFSGRVDLGAEAVSIGPGPPLCRFDSGSVDQAEIWPNCDVGAGRGLVRRRCIVVSTDEVRWSCLPGRDVMRKRNDSRPFSVALRWSPRSLRT